MVREMTMTLKRMVEVINAKQDEEALRLAKMYTKLENEYLHRG